MQAMFVIMGKSYDLSNKFISVPVKKYIQHLIIYVLDIDYLKSQHYILIIKVSTSCELVKLSIFDQHRHHL
jgi:hypothetical protein